MAGFYSPMWWATTAGFLVGVCLAAPVTQPFALADRNSIVLTAALFAGIGAVLGACVCCRRRKKGFEPNSVKDRKEFENEACAAEAAARSSEYPIFHALSSPQSQRAATLNAAPVRAPSPVQAAPPVPPPQLQPHIQPLVVGGQHHHDLFAENDNNNGPISPADLQNIENNNAGEYIPNLNQILAPVVELPVRQQPSPLLMQHQPLIFAPHSHVPFNVNEVQCQSVSSSNGGEPPLNGRGMPSDTIAIIMPTDTNPFLDDTTETDIMVHLTDVRIDVDDECCTEMPLLGARAAAFSTPSRGIQSMFGLKAQPSVVDAKAEEFEPHLEAPPNDEDDDEDWMQSEHSTNNFQQNAVPVIGPCTSEEARGVEEALLALDFAISGADGQSDDDDEDGADSDTDSDIAKETTAEHILPNSEEDFKSVENATPIAENINTSKPFSKDIDTVRAAASQMVNTVIEESMRRIYEQRDKESDDLNASENLVAAEIDGLAPIAGDTAISDDGLLPFLNSSVVSIDADRSADSLMDFNFEQMAIEASTPFVPKKMHTFVDSTFTAVDDPTRPKRAAQNLFGHNSSEVKADAELNQMWCAPIEADSSFDAVVADAPFAVDQTSNAVADNDTFIATDQTFVAPIKKQIAATDLTFGAPTDKPIVTADQTFVAPTDKTFVAADQTITTPANKTFVPSDQTFTGSPTKPHANLPEIRISTDSDIASVDLTTATPVNTPIELNYSVDGWDTFITNSMKKPLQSGHRDADAQPKATFLNPALIDAAPPPGPSGDATFAMDDYSSSGWSNDDEGAMLLDDADDDQCEDGALLSLTFDSLRKQLTEALPHAQGAMSCSGGLGELDDEMGDEATATGELLSNDFDFENKSIQPQAEMFINYKRALSPIPEESEDESTCKTFIMNDTKCLDSTSTGNLADETAILGVNKTLMASNDTLFNFEDTLGDRDDMFSPRTPSSEPIATAAQALSDPTTSTNSSIYDSRSTKDLINRQLCTADEFSNYTQRSATVIATPLDDTRCVDHETPHVAWEPSGVDVAAVAELLSPDQPKTFSEDTCIELAGGSGGGGGTSSDLSLTFDGTFTATMDDRTCILVDQVSSPRPTDEQEEGGSALLHDVWSEPVDETFAVASETVILENGGLTGLLDEDCGEMDVDILLRSSESDGNAEKAASPFDLSGEEDPWALSSGDIRLAAANASEMMSTSFSTSPKEWDSDGDEDSSEEFMYVRGTTEATDDTNDGDATINVIRNGDNRSASVAAAGGASVPPGDSGDVVVTESEVWNAHTDQVMVSPTTKDDEHEATGNSSSSEADEEWVPSCWDSMAQPARSSLKSPDKTSSEEDSSGSDKKRPRRVVFKKQNYHSVYEYPKEMVAMSPAYSEPQMHAWEQRSFDGHMRLLQQKHDGPARDGDAYDMDDEFADDMDMFMVSSSARPFHGGGGRGGSMKIAGSQFNAQCNTWPTSDAEFSWSQIQENTANQKEQYQFPAYSDMPIKWPENWRHLMASDRDTTDGGLHNGDEHNRSDSGVGESAELLTDSLGDLCHTKASLRLDLLSPSTKLIPLDPLVSQLKDSLSPIVAPQTLSSFEDDEIHTHTGGVQHNNAIPSSFSGSMDSLSSSSGSERQVSFTTFGKAANSQNTTMPSPRIDTNVSLTRTNSTGMVFIDNVELADASHSPPHSLRNSSLFDTISLPFDGLISLSTVNSSGKPQEQQQHQNDSTDEDSGIESIMRIKSTTPPLAPSTTEQNTS